MQSRAAGAVEAIAIKNLQELLRKKGITAEALFTKYDFDGNGSIEGNEFKSALESITGQQAPESILLAIFNAVDTNNDGSLELEEILALLDAGGKTESMSGGSSVEVRDHPNAQYNGTYELQSTKINGKSWYMNPSGARLYFYNANSGGAPSWSLDDREQDGSNDWYRGGWARPRSDNSLPTGVRRWVGVGKISVTPSSSEAIDSDPEITTLDEYSSDSNRNFVFAPEKLTWTEHNEYARASGGNLASITSAEENEQVTRIAGGNAVWIGGIRTGSGNGPGADHWHWSDGQPWTYNNWNPGEPNNHGGGENRVHLGLQAPGTWNDVNDQWRGAAVYEMSADIEISDASPNVEISDASLGQPIRFRINNRPSAHDAWVGIYPAGAGDNEHGEQHQRWHWLRDIDVNNASFPAQSAGQWSIRVFSDGGFTLHHSEDFEIEDGGSNEFDNFSESMLSKVAAFERDVLEGRITVEEARATADAEAKTQIDNLPFFLRSPAQSLWKNNADRMQAEVTARLAERSATIAAGAAVAGTVAGVAAASSMAEDSPEEVPAASESPTETETEYSSHDDWHEEHSVEVPDRVEVDTEVEIPEYEDPDDWYRTTKVAAGTRVSVPDRVRVAPRSRTSSSISPSISASKTSPQTIPQEPVESSSELSSMSAIVNAFTDARMLSDQRELADSIEGKTFEFEIKATSAPERTFGIGIDDAYRGGMTVIGEVPEVGEVEVRFASGADSGSMSKGRNSTISASISGWNGIRKRLIVNAQ